MKISIYKSLPKEARQIRQTVFVEEQGFHEEFDQTDDAAVHFVAYGEDKLPVGTCRIFWDTGIEGYVLGRLAVLREYRGKNIGAALLGEAEKYVQKMGGKSISLHAQCQVSGFYRKQGFVECSEVEDEQGCPHVWMKKDVLAESLSVNGREYFSIQKNVRPRLIILRGNSGSGKTTVARELQRKFGRGTLVIPQDTVRRDMLWARDGANTKALPLLIHLLEYGRENCAVTILEGILDSDCYRPLFQRVIEEYGSDIYAYYYDLPFEETLRRHETKANRFSFGEEDMRRWWKEKDFIGIIPEEIITKDVSLSEAVERIYQAVAM